MTGREDRVNPCEACFEETPPGEGIEMPRFGWVCPECAVALDAKEQEFHDDACAEAREGG